jgi:flagellar basal-body rod protein FlgC
MSTTIASIAVSGLQAASTRASGAASNIANRNTSGRVDEDGTYDGYSTLVTEQTARSGGGVSASLAPVDPSFVLAFDPSDPNANERGEVGIPAGSEVEDAVELQRAQHAYEANAAVLRTADEMSRSLLDMDA